jgi:tripartite-type tricarboxylate transporter receptor subunit TctC
MKISRRALLGTALSLPLSAHAQSANGTIIFPFTAGSGGDVTARLIAEKLQAGLNTPFITENRTGGNGRVGIVAVKNATVESKTYLITTGPTMSIYPHFYPKLGFDVINDFTPISRLADFEFALAVPINSPVNSLADLKKLLETTPTKANYGTPSLGTFPHFFGLVLGQKMNVKIEPIPFRGSSQMVQNIVGDQISMGITPLSDMLAQHQAKH